IRQYVGVDAVLAVGLCERLAAQIRHPDQGLPHVLEQLFVGHRATSAASTARASSRWTFEAWCAACSALPARCCRSTCRYSCSAPESAPSARASAWRRLASSNTRSAAFEAAPGLVQRARMRRMRSCVSLMVAMGAIPFRGQGRLGADSSGASIFSALRSFWWLREDLPELLGVPAADRLAHDV